MAKKTTKTDAGKQTSTASQVVAKATAAAKTAETAAKTAVAEKTAEASKNVVKAAGAAKAATKAAGTAGKGAAAGAAKGVKDTASKARKAVSPAKKDPQIIHYFEINGEQISTEVITERIKETYKADGHRIGSVKSLDVYYNFDEQRAYYVVNGKAEGKFVEF